MKEKPNCYDCVHRLPVAGDTHSRCNNHSATVVAHEHGIKKGWFRWPMNFDPTWLIACDGFSSDPADRMERKELDPLLELIGLLK